MRSSPLFLLGGLAVLPAAANAAGTISLTIPQLKVAEYHKPYIAVYVEPVGGGAMQTVAVWYDIRKKGSEAGTKWLADLRAWWRKGGKNLDASDGVSGATRAPGTHSIPLPANIKPGAYTLTVEAAREGGGREVVSIPLSVPAKAASGSGKSELGAVTISAR